MIREQFWRGNADRVLALIVAAHAVALQRSGVRFPRLKQLNELFLNILVHCGSLPTGMRTI